MTDLSNLTVELRDDQLVLATGRLERRFAWNGGHLISTRLALPDGPCWEYPADRPDLMIPGVVGLLGGGRLEVVDQSATAAFAAHRRAVVTCSVGELEIRRVFRLYPDCPAIACDIYLRGRADGPWRSGEPRPYSIPSVACVGTAPGEACSHLGWPLFAAPVTDRIATGTRHLKVEIAAFADVTDVRNNLVSATRVLPYRAPSPHQGNVLLAVDSLSDEGCFMLREAPCSDMQLAWPGCDFIVARGDLVSVGLGLDPEDLDSDGWTRTYGVVVGLTAHGELGLLQALRAYQRAIRVVDPGRDHLVMANTWGDRSRDERVSETFSLGEIKAGREFGISHLQLDDGWQTGRSGMSVEGGSLEGIWNRGDW
ncbi:MAG: alpha-galactosidase, partial [Armatimonadetes bacterium]|nr:alpha-galactosidase [Armatimonadota bacterium]